MTWSFGCKTFALAAAVLLAAADARADTAGDPSAADEGLLRRFLELQAASCRASRELSGAVDAATAAVLVAPGVVLATRADAASEVAGAALLVRGGLDLYSAGLDLFPSRSETLLRHYDARRVRGEPVARATEETEQEWSRVVRQADENRSLWGTVGLAEGVVVLAGGVYLMLAAPVVSSWSRQDQTTLGLIVTMVGLHDSVVSAWELLGSREDTLWSLYQATKAAGSGARATSGRPSFAVAPIAGGAVGTVRLVL